MRKQSVPTRYEGDEQEALFDWAEWQLGLFPELDYMHAIPNGGSRHPAEAARLKKQGVKPGVPDIFLPVPRGRYHGLYIEMKREKTGVVSDDQRKWIHFLESMDFKTTVCFGFDAAKYVIQAYMKLPPFQNK